ncbi:hypothetical protein OSTOST_02689, partial [Ostertagia ostertagi]
MNYNDPKMQINLRIIACCVLLFFVHVKAQLSDEECAAYHDMVTQADYETFVDDCAGKEVLGFDRGVSDDFHASFLNEHMFNKVFANARRVSFHIYVQNTDFKEVRMSKLEYLNGGLTIRNNVNLKSFRIQRRWQFERTQAGPTTVTVDGNPMLDSDSMSDLRHLCPHCDIFPWTKCSALDPVEFSNYDKLIQQCAGEKIIKVKPMTSMTLHLNKITERQFKVLFSQATHVQMGISMQDVQWTQLTFPKLVRHIPCGPGERTLRVVHNDKLKWISLPMYHSEGFGRLNAMWNVEVRNNILVTGQVLNPLATLCRFCKVQVYKECDSITVQQARNVTKFVELCGGKRIWKPSGNQIIEIDISVLKQEFIDELFQDVTYIKMCITLRNSQIKYLRMPNLVEMYPCKPGRPAFIIENNPYLEVVQVSTTFKWDISDHSFRIVYNPALTHYPPVERCKYCEFAPITKRCALEIRRYGDVELVQTCAGAEYIAPREGFYLTVSSSKVTQEQMNALCANAVYMEICISIVDSDYTALRCPRLKEIRPCLPGRPALTIVNNLVFQELIIVDTIIFPENDLIFKITENPNLPIPVVNKLKHMCERCEISANLECGLQGRTYTEQQLAAACAGKKIIRPAEGSIIVFSSPKVTEAQMNAICSQAVFMEVCIDIINSQYTSLRCPHLKELKPCQPECDSITVQDARNVTKFVELCGGKRIWKPSGNQIIEIDISVLKQEFVDELFQDVTYIKMCITLRNSQIKYLRMPNLVEMYPCKPGRLAFTIENNPYLEVIQVSTTFKWEICDHSFHIVYNPGLTQYPPVEKCKYCVLKPIMSRFILPPLKISENETELTESRANSKSLVSTIPETVVYPPKERRPALTIVNNLVFQELIIADTIIFPENDLIFKITENPNLPIPVVNKLKHMCERCEISANLECGLQGGTYTEQQLAAACAGKKIIRPAEGSIIVFSSPKVTEAQMNAICSQAVFMEVCIDIINSQYTSLRCPHLKELKPCQPGRPAIRIINNLQLKIVEFNTFIFPTGVTIIEINGNPLLPMTAINPLKRICPGCKINDDSQCQLEARLYSGNEVVRVCAGKEVIKGRQGFPLRVSSKDVTEKQMNALCANAVYMEICITIMNSNFKSLRCPRLHEIRPCQPGQPAIKIVDNIQFQELVITDTIIFPQTELIFEITENPNLPITVVNKLKHQCERCQITADLDCGLQGRYTSQQLIAACAGKKIIRPGEGRMMVFGSAGVTERQMNAICSQAIYMEVCIDVIKSQYTALRCPYLRELKPCHPGQPALVIEDNLLFQELVIMDTIIFPENDLIFQITGNPNLPITVINKLKHKCEHCLITANLDCGLQGRYTSQQLIAACAGKKIIRPSEGHIIQFHSSQVTEAQMNAICSQAIFMEVCIDIFKSQYKAFRCPYLKELKSCQPGRPAIRIVDNLLLQVLEIRTPFIFLPSPFIIEITGNPLLSSTALTPLKQLCPGCKID